MFRSIEPLGGTKSCPQAGLVSVIIPTKNSELYLAQCLRSIKTQTYSPIEILVADNGSTDRTLDVAQTFGARIIRSAGERSRQINDALQEARGQYIYRVDSDFVVDRNVVAECVGACAEGFDAVAVHNDSSPQNGFWARVRAMERGMYRDDTLIVGARFFRADVIAAIGGFDNELVAGEDYDIHNRLLLAGYHVGRASAGEVHLGEPRSLREIWSKNHYYGRTILRYLQRHPGRALQQSLPIRAAYLRNWKTFVANPLETVGLCVMVIVKYLACLAGIVSAIVSRADRREIGG